MRQYLPPRTLEDGVIVLLRLAALKACRGNRTHAATFCGCSPRAMTEFVRQCKDAGHKIDASAPDTHGIEGEQNEKLKKIMEYIFNFPKGD